MLVDHTSGFLGDPSREWSFQERLADNYDLINSSKIQLCKVSNISQ